MATFIAYIVLEHAPRVRALFAHSDSRKLTKHLKEHLAEGSTCPLRIVKEMTEAARGWKKERVPNPDYKPRTSTRQGEQTSTVKNEAKEAPGPADSGLKALAADTKPRPSRKKGGSSLRQVSTIGDSTSA